MTNMWNRAMGRCYHLFPCLSNPAWRSSIGLKVLSAMLHLIFAGVLFLFHKDLTEKVPWYTALYLLLFFSTFNQYSFTAGSSPGYVLDAMRIANQSESLTGDTSIISNKDNLLGANATSWTKLVMDMYPPGSSVSTWTCTYCNVVQPPRAKHCHDCDKCVLQFDHHCPWLGTCIGQGNHCRFWWYICEETALCLWTGILYIACLKANISRARWMNAVIIMLLVILSITLIFLVLLLLFHSYIIITNQTTYELVRRRRIPYLSGLPKRVHPFSKGICRNLYYFCFARGSLYYLETLPTALELEVISRPYTCLDVLKCRCCC